MSRPNHFYLPENYLRGSTRELFDSVYLSDLFHC